jgi:NADPH:quinone reductase-like Zn-dependent oxidoreductase
MIMKAVRIHQYGGREELTVEQAPMPVVQADEVLVRTIAASVNPVDWKIREGYLKEAIPYEMPLILGWDISGVISEVGENVTDFVVGDAVYSRPDISRDGTYAEYVAIRANEVAHKPKTMSHSEAASLPLAVITAWEVLITSAQIKEGQKVLIHAGSGGVGSLAIQLAKSRGAYVIATTSAKNSALVASLGADEVIDYHTQNFAEVVADVDVVFDTLGGDVQTASWSVLKKGGILVSIVSEPSEETAEKIGVKSAFVFIQPNAEILKKVAELVDSGQMRAIVCAEFALDDIAKAHELSESGRSVGKIVLSVGHP